MRIRNVLIAVTLTLVGITSYFVYSTTYLGDTRFEQLNLRNVPYLNSLPWLQNVGQAATVADTPVPTPVAAVPAITVAPTTAVEAETVAPIETPSVPELSPRVESVVVLISEPVDTFDPYKMVSNHPDGSVSLHIWDTLTRLNNNLEVEPYLAESWRIVNNFTWEFTLRENITFHNGERVNAEAVRFSIRRAQNLPGSLETFAFDADLSDIEVVDATTIRIITNEPVANIPYYLAFLEILPPVYYGQSTLAELAKRPIGSGPYQAAPMGENREVVLDAVSTYWGGTPKIPQIIFRPTPSENERVTGLLIEETVISTDLPPLSAQTWRMGDTRLEMIESTRRLFIGMDIQPETPLANEKVRQALNYAVNVDEILDNWFLGHGSRYGSWVNPPHNDPDLPPWPYDPEQAKSLLGEAGYRSGFTTTLAIPLGFYPEAENIAFTVAQQLAEVDIAVEIEEVEWPIYLRRLLSNDKPDLFLLSLNSHGDGLEDIKNLSSEFRFNPVNWQDDIYDDGVRRAVNTLDDEVRRRRILNVQEIAYQQAPWVWLWRPFDYYAVSNALDWKPRRDGVIYLYQPANSP